MLSVCEVKMSEPLDLLVDHTPSGLLMVMFPIVFRAVTRRPRFMLRHSGKETFPTRPSPPPMLTRPLTERPEPLSPIVTLPRLPLVPCFPMLIALADDS